MNFPSQIYFNEINHGYRAAILKKKILWVLPFYTVVATYFYCEKVRTAMRTAIVSNLLSSLGSSYIQFSLLLALLCFSWRKKTLLKDQRTPKYYDHGCRFQKWHLWIMVLFF